MGQKMWGYCCALFLLVALAPSARADESKASTASSPGDAVRRIEAVLNQPLRSPLEYVETPLNQVLTIVSEDYDIPIQFDAAALDAVATSPEIEVTVNIANVSLRSALELMLSNAGAEELTYIIDKEVLMITTQEEAEKKLEVVVYRVDDLNIPQRSPCPGATAHADFNSLIDVITSCVERQSWVENGTGEGEIRSHGNGLIVISQTRRVHDKIQQLLDDMRRNLAAIKADEAARERAGTDSPVTVGLRLADDVVAEPSEVKAAIAELLLQSVDCESGDPNLDESTVFLKFEGNRIFVRHQPQVVREVEEAAQGIGHPRSYPSTACEWRVRRRR